MRDGAGALLWSLRGAGAPATYAICDGAARPAGTLSEVGARRVLESPSLRAAISGPPEEALLAHPGGALRLHDEGGQLRILDGQGVPLAQLGRGEGRGVAFDPGGTPTATAELTDGRRVVRARDGALRYYLRGVADDRAAAAFAVDALEPLERLLLLRHLDPHPLTAPISR